VKAEEEEQAARDRLRAKLVTIVGEGEIPLLAEALTHPSYANEVGIPDNQRLEFLGDAVLGLCVSELVARTKPDADEGALTRMRSALVNAEALAKWARQEMLGECLALGKGARAGGDREQTNVLADTVEALVAAVYEARGLPGARALVDDITRDGLAGSELLGMRDPKSTLQERVQAAGYGAPRYRVVSTEGPAHEPTFEVQVEVDDEPLARGKGRSKRQAERAAAMAAIAAWELREPAASVGEISAGDSGSG
jgi:ribonuclease-3